MDGVFTTKVFGFNMTRLPYRDSVISNRMIYLSIVAESLRIFRASSTSHNAVESVKTLITRMINQGAIVSQMKNSIAKMINRHGINLKFGTVGGELVNQIFS